MKFGLNNNGYAFSAAVLVLVALFSCDPEWKNIGSGYEPQIAVEGWIEEGFFANVILTQTMGIGAGTGNATDIPVRWAKVTVSDGEHEEILVGRVDARYFPPFIYTGSEIRGEAGKHYTLKVEYSGRTLSAETWIPESVPIDDIVVEQSEESDTLYAIRIAFRDNPSEKNFYKVFSRVTPGDSRYGSSFLGTVSDEVFSGDNIGTITVSRPFRQLDAGDYSPFFNRGDSVYVKLTQLPEEGFDFWSDYENAVTIGTGILFPSSSNIRSNISGGLGIWCGYGTDAVMTVIPE